MISAKVNAENNIIATRLHIAWNGNLRNVIMYNIKIETIAIDNNKKNASINLSYITIISFIMGVVVDLVLESVHFLLATGIGAIVYIVLIFGTKVLSVQDIRELTGSLKNIKGSI